VKTRHANPAVAWAFLLGAAMSGASFRATRPARAEELPRVINSKGPSPTDRMVTKTMLRTLRDSHVSRLKIDDTVSQRAFDLFLKVLDPMKMYFLKSDIDSFESYRNRLDDMTLEGDTSFSYTVFKVYLKRLQEIMPKVHQLIDQDHDYSIDEKIAKDRDVVDYATSFEESVDRWRKLIKLNVLSLKADKKSMNDIRDQLHRRYRTQEKTRVQTDIYELLEMYLSAISNALDPHSTYMAPRAQDNFDILMSLKLEGIGATLQPDDGYTTVASIVAGGAADKDGRLKVGDRIVAVAQESESTPVDVVDMKLDDVVSLIRGSAGTKVKLTVTPKAGGETKIYEITRAKIQLEDSAARGEVLERGVKANGQPFRVGYINLPSFYMDMDAARANRRDYRSTTRDVSNLLKDFTSKNVDVVVLDLSKNGGGSLTEAINCTGLFIDKGPVVQVKDYDGNVQAYDDETRGEVWKGPLVVMTSKMSASASEIFAGAIKDYKRGLVVGDPATHGKGTVQTLLEMSELMYKSQSRAQHGALKLTIQQFYLPDGQSTQRDGVAADVILPSVLAHMDIGEADLDHALPSDKVRMQEHKNYRMVDSAMRVALQDASNARIQKSADYEKLLKRIEAYRKQKDEKFLSLREADYLARRAELNSDEEEEKLLEDAQFPKDKAFDPNFQNEEVLNVARDYVEALQKVNLAKAL
jgi:carboxyl-terminal processing protease